MTTGPSSPPSAAPRYATPRDPARPTYGGHLAAVARLMGRPLIPWQRQVADTALELDEQGQFVYSTIYVTVPRQSGKSMLDIAGNLQQLFMGPNRRVWYTAQSGQHASAMWREYTDAMVRAESPFHRLLSRRLTNGSETLTLTANGSTFRPHPPSEDSMHSKQSDRNTIDEAWAFTELAGAQLLQAITPTTTTRRVLTGQTPQLWILSTEGTVESTFLNPRLDEVRDHCPPGVALFDWGIPADGDPDDLDLIARHHPGFGHLTDMATLRKAQAELRDPSEFARAYGNRRTGAVSRLIPAATWARMQWTRPIPAGVPICYGVAVGVDGADTTVVVASQLPDGRIVGAIPEGGHRPGTHWAAQYVAALTAAFPAPVVVDGIGPSAGLRDVLDRTAGVELLPIRSGEVVAAVQDMMQGGADPAGARWLLRPHPAFDAAAELAARRWLNDGAFVLGRRQSVGSIGALEAAVLAAHGVQHLPTKVPMQLF